MRKLTKRILSFIVVAVVMITSLPFSVMAETAANTDGKGMTIDLSKTDESIDEVINNIQGLNVLANGEKENAHQHGSSEKHTHTVDAQEVITDSESNSFEDGIFDIVVEETVEQEVDVKLESTTTTESPATDFVYSIENGEVTITGYIGSATEVVIPEKIEGYPVTSIGDEAFSRWSSSTSITIPDGVTSIGDHAFYNCSSLTSITVSADNHTYSSDDGVLLNKEKTILICCPGGKVGEYTIPDSVTSIGDYAFSSCSALTSITIPDSVTSIGDHAFSYCSSLTSITIPDSVTSIGDYAFFCCSSLTSITIPDSVTSIGDEAFSWCSSLESITIPDSVTSIGDYAFDYCSSLTSITIPDSVTSIGDYAFFCCSSLTSITIPDSVTSIGDYAFSDCSSLTSITIPDGVTSIGGSAFAYCDSLTSITVSEDNLTYLSEEGVLFNKAKTEIICCPAGKVGEYTIPDSVTSIVFQAFYDCSSLTSITIPDSVTSIGNCAFLCCSSLKTVNYTGSEELWNKISVSSGNDYLLNATIHFNYIPGAIPEIITPSTDSDVAIDSDTSMVTGLIPEMTPVDVAAKFEGAENIRIVDKNGNVLAADALVGTGSKIQLVENGEVVDEVTVVIQGEIDGNGIIDSDDAIYMLRNTLFPDMFPVVVDDDIDGNGVYDSDDAIYLLRYTLFPDMFPLK